MRKPYGVLIAVLLIATSALAADTEDRRKQEDRLQTAGQVMGEILNIPDNIPQNLLDKTRCIVVIPSVLKAAFIVGGAYGRGAMVCRSGKNFTGPWGPPAMYALEGGSFGLQLGAQATDFVFLIMNERGATSLLHSKVKLGGDATVAAGPVGRDAEADTDVAMRAEILTYSRSRGLFAGVSLEGSTLRPDDDANQALYGRKIHASEIVLGPAPATPDAAHTLISLLDKASPHAKTA
ncbi:MAG: lipid-binding SYLF domain-containing protein [Candidatus Acidiferrales bacterium]